MAADEAAAGIGRDAFVGPGTAVDTEAGFSAFTEAPAADGGDGSAASAAEAALAGATEASGLAGAVSGE